MPDIDGSIFSPNQPGKLSNLPFLVTVQFQFKIDAQTQQGAELAVMKGISLLALIAPAQISYGCHAEPLTAEMLREMGVDLTRKS